MSVVDNLLLFRCVQIVRRLTQKSRDIGMFCNISGDTLADEEFFPQFLDYMQANKRSGRPDRVRIQPGSRASRRAWRANAISPRSPTWALRSPWIMSRRWRWISCRLKAIGFRHLKVRANTMMRGMNSAGAAVAAEDFKKLLTRHGLNLIAERVEDEKTVVQLLDYAVDYAQGYLFGEPRAVREDSLKPVSALDAAPVVPFARAG